MPSWLIDVAIAVDAQIELLSVQHQALVHRGEQQMLPAPELVHRDSQKTVVTPCVASDYRSVAIGSGLVGTDNLPLQGIREIHQLGLVEFQKSHNRFYLFFISQHERATARQINTQDTVDGEMF